MRNLPWKVERLIRYSFHFVKGQKLIPDLIGIEIRDRATVQFMARQLIHEVQQEADQFSEDWQGLRIDAEGSSVNVDLSALLETKLPWQSQWARVTSLPKSASRKIDM